MSNIVERVAKILFYSHSGNEVNEPWSDVKKYLPATVTAMRVKAREVLDENFGSYTLLELAELAEQGKIKEVDNAKG